MKTNRQKISIGKQISQFLLILLLAACSGTAKRSGGSGSSDSINAQDSLWFCSDTALNKYTDNPTGVLDSLSVQVSGDANSSGNKNNGFRRSESLETKNWLLFRGDAALSGYTDAIIPKKPALLWTFKSNTRTSSSPVIAGGVTYWSDERGYIRGVDLTGVQVFDYDFKTAVKATPMIYDSILYIGRIDGFMCAISLSQKNILWEYETMGQVSASANCVNFEGAQAVVFGSYDNYLYCLDSKTGKEINRFESGYYINGAVALWKQYVIFGGCDGWLRVIDSRTGVSSDSLQVETYIPASPAIMDDYCYIGDHSGNFYELNLENGKIVRHRIIMEAIGDGANVSVPALSVSNLYIIANDQHLYSINRKDGSVHWKYLLKGSTGDSSPVVCKDKIIVCTRTGIVSILNAHTGVLEWEYDTGEQIVASPAVISKSFYILTTRGTLFCFGEMKK